LKADCLPAFFFVVMKVAGSGLFIGLFLNDIKYF
jgi:hypothetical protein